MPGPPQINSTISQTSTPSTLRATRQLKPLAKLTVGNGKSSKFLECANHGRLAVMLVMPEKSGFYETVTDVNSDPRFFSLLGRFCSLFRLQSMLFSTGVSIRTLCEPSWLCAHWGSVGEVDAASYRTASEGQTRHAVIGTRVGQNKRASLFYLKRRQRRTARIVPG
jgi:hypothetical protein